MIRHEYFRITRWKERPSTTEKQRLGAWEEIRTPDLRITNALLYRLSYPGAESNITRSISWALSA